MSESLYISDTALPVNQDFRALKNEGLALIQQYGSSKWTNLNPGDPGVTILDQLCYALTELGYCNDFDIKDILTGPNGKLETANQFFLPQQILTTSPVTIDDYCKYLIDGITGIDNVVIEPVSVAEFFNIPAYKVYLHINSKDRMNSTAICNAAFFYLNQSRNIGELFLFPEALTPVEFGISGNIEIERDADEYTVLQQVTEKINNYIFPKVMPAGYYSLSATDADTDKTWNGPLLNNGYILTEALGTKKDHIRAIDMAPLVMQVAGVTAVNQLSFFILPYVILQELRCAKQEILTLNAVRSATGNQPLQVKKGGHAITLRAEEMIFSPAPGNAVSDINLVYGKALQATAPAGAFRDINTYYSVQNTFPAIFATGPDGTAPDASTFQVAQARQLKGYLTLFDQVLANQFSQLANISRLFSFKNALTGAPSDFAALMNMKSPYEREHETIPVPYMSFAPTYFYQSLYSVPGIKPLLKNNDAFNYSYSEETKSEAEYHSWKAYTQDPYNAYMSSLMRLMQNADTDLERRNNILDHLLARHGESPLVIDTYICDSVYSGNALKDKVIIKSLFLQNYALLSYNRQKSCNFLSADKLSGWREETNPESHQINNGYDELLSEGNTIDFIFNSGKINEAEKISPADIVNYAAVELKLSLLFALKIRYQEFILQNFEKAKSDVSTDNELRQARWLITQMRGCIMIETALLISCLQQNNRVKEGWVSDTDIVFVFPGFIPLLNKDELKIKSAMDVFLQTELPATRTYRHCYCNQQVLGEVIDAFVLWHNCMRYHAADTVAETLLQNATVELISILNQIQPFGSK
ncbi:hypothetical protein [Ferruginibacter profundus]